jgi:hypothetical protein
MSPSQTPDFLLDGTSIKTVQSSVETLNNSRVSCSAGERVWAEDFSQPTVLANSARLTAKAAGFGSFAR